MWLKELSKLPLRALWAAELGEEIWRFPEIGGTPSHHPFIDWDFPWNKPTSELGVPPWRAGNHQIFRWSPKYVLSLLGSFPVLARCRKCLLERTISLAFCYRRSECPASCRALSTWTREPWLFRIQSHIIWDPPENYTGEKSCSRIGCNSQLQSIV